MKFFSSPCTNPNRRHLQREDLEFNTKSPELFLCCLQFIVAVCHFVGLYFP